MTREEWYNLEAGDIVQDTDGNTEVVVEYFDGEKYIDGGKSLYPMSEFDWRSFTKIGHREV